MTTSRLLHNSIFEDDFFGSLSYMERLLWIGLITTVADDQGRFLYHPALIRVKVFLYDNLTDNDIEKALDNLSASGKIHTYTANGKKLCQIVNWWKYQKPSWANESRFPPPEGWIDRVKINVAGGKIVTKNWDKEGGFSQQTQQIPTQIPTQIPIQIPIEPDSGTVKVNVKVKNTTTTTNGSAIFSEYESNFGVLTSGIADRLSSLLEDYPEEWILHAMKEALAHEARNLKYVEAILRRWKREGFRAGKKGAEPKKEPKKEAKKYTPEELARELTKKEEQNAK